MDTKKISQNPSLLESLHSARSDRANKNDKNKHTGLIPKPTQQGVDVSVSNEARSLAEARKKAFDIAMSSPEVREDRVAELKARINGGTYKVDSGKVADGMLKEAIQDKLAMTMHEDAKRR